MIKTRGLSHIHLMVRNLERSLRFYQRVFGVEEQLREGPDIVFVNTPGCSDVIALHQAEPMSDAVGKTGGIAHFGFRLLPGQDMPSALREIEAAGGRVLSKGEHVLGEPFAYVTDPDGYKIEIWR